MKQFVRLLLYNYFSKSGQKPACQIAVKTFLSVPFNVTGSPALYSTCRKLSSYKIINSSTADEGKKLNQQSGEGNSRNENSVIYYGTLTSQIKGVKVFTCTSSIGGLIIQPMLIQNVITGENVSLSLAMGTVVGFFTFVTPFLIHSLTKKYVTEIRYNSKTDTYTATTLSFFLRRIDVSFISFMYCFHLFIQDLKNFFYLLPD